MIPDCTSGRIGLVMPIVVRANTNATAIIIADRLADRFE